MTDSVSRASKTMAKCATAVQADKAKKQNISSSAFGDSREPLVLLYGSGLEDLLRANLY